MGRGKRKRPPVATVKPPELAPTRQFEVRSRLPSRTAFIVLALISVAALVPFVAKPFHMDDPLFVWTARQMREDPVNFYGYTLNWYGTEERMADVMQNPPLVCYGIAAITTLAGFSEIVLHVAFMVPMIVLIWGAYRLAEQFGGRPIVAALLTLFTPAVLVSGMSVMCDVTMLAFWVWAVVFWERGLRSQRAALLFVAAGFIVLAALCKYFGVCLLPLLAAYALFGRQPARLWLPPWIAAVVALLGYELLTRYLYGHGFVTGAVKYASTQEYKADRLSAFFTGLAFLGGSTAGFIGLAPWLWSRRLLAGLSAVAALLVVMALIVTAGRKESQSSWQFAVQFALWATMGIALLALAVQDLYERRDAGAVLLFLWIFGTFGFAAFVNWTINVRSIVPLAPAAAVLVTRRLERVHTAAAGLSSWRLGVALLPSVVVSFAVAWADTQWAASARRGAERIADQYMGEGRTVWFAGHWGFQYYLQERGGLPLDLKARESPVRRGDVVVLPSNNCFVPERVPPGYELREVVEETPCRWLAVLNAEVAAGFYSSIFGPLPFRFGRAPTESYAIYECRGPE